MSLKYESTYKESIENPEKFWAQAATKVHWYHQWDKVLDVVDNHYRWFVGGCMNSCYNALDLHIDNGRGDQLAIIYDSPVTDTKRTYTYRELRQRVSKSASILVNKECREGRSRCYLHAYDSRSGHRDASMCAHWSDSLCCLWWICRT